MTRYTKQDKEMLIPMADQPLLANLRSKGIPVNCICHTCSKGMGAQKVPKL